MMSSIWAATTCELPPGSGEATIALTPANFQPEIKLAQPLLSVIIPVYNEVATIDELLRRVLAATRKLPTFFRGNAPNGNSIQIIVVDDASTDGTAAKLNACRRRVRVVVHPANRGKGAAIRTALEYARGEFTIVQDADLEYDPRDYPRLLAPLLARQADAVYGSRYLGSRRPWSVCRAGVLLLNQTLRGLYGVRLTDEATCYKVFRTEHLRRMRLESDRFEFCPEVTAKACRMGLRIQEVPISYAARTVAAGKKIRWRDGLFAIRALWRWRNWRPAH